MNFKKWVKSIQTAGYNGARTVVVLKEGLAIVEEQQNIITSIVPG